MQVGTQDGRVKVFGKEGVEAMFRSPAQCATAHLQFLDELGAVLRLTQARRTETHLLSVCSVMLSRSTAHLVSVVTCALLARLTARAAAQDGDVQLWGVHAGGLLDSLTCTDAVTAVAALLPEPYLVLGCRSGGLRVAALLDEAGAPADSAREAASLGLLPYQGALGACATGLVPHHTPRPRQGCHDCTLARALLPLTGTCVHAPPVAPEEVPGACGPVVALAALVAGAHRRLVLAHAASPALVWDLRCAWQPLWRPHTRALPASHLHWCRLTTRAQLSWL